MGSNWSHECHLVFYVLYICRFSSLPLVTIQSWAQFSIYLFGHFYGVVYIYIACICTYASFFVIFFTENPVYRLVQ